MNDPISVDSFGYLDSASDPLSQPADKKPFPWWWILIAVVVVAAVVAIVVAVSMKKKKKKNKKGDEGKEEEGTSSSSDLLDVPKLQVLTCVRPVEGNYHYVIYFTFQEKAQLFRFFINDMLVGDGSFEKLDIRYSPPYRRVAFETKVAPKLPVKISVQAFSQKGVIVGAGTQVMRKLCYHNAS